MIYYSISLFCTTFPIVFVFVLFILTWKWLYGASLVNSPSARSTSKPRRSRHRGTTNASYIVDTSDTSLFVPVSNKLHVNYCKTACLFSVKTKR